MNKLGSIRSANISDAFAVNYRIVVIYHIIVIPNVTIIGKYFQHSKNATTGVWVLRGHVIFYI